MGKIVNTTTGSRFVTGEPATHTFPPIETPPSPPNPLPTELPEATPELLDTEVEMSVQIGSSKHPVKELLQGLKPGKLFKLDQHEGAPAAILVNGVKVGTGMVAVAPDGKYAIQVLSVGVTK